MPKKTNQGKSLSELSQKKEVPIEVQAQPKTKKVPDSEELTVSPRLAAMLTEDESPESSDSFSSKKLFNRDERDFYAERWRFYSQEFNLNKSSDVGIVHRIIMEEILTERLYKKLMESSSDHGSKEQGFLSQELDASNKRYQSALEALGASRDKRIKNRETSNISIADVAKQFFSEGKKKLQADKEKWDEEEKLLEKQQDHLLGLEFGVSRDSDEEELGE